MSCTAADSLVGSEVEDGMDLLSSAAAAVSEQPSRPGAHSSNVVSRQRTSRPGGAAADRQQIDTQAAPTKKRYACFIRIELRYLVSNKAHCTGTITLPVPPFPPFLTPSRSAQACRLLCIELDHATWYRKTVSFADAPSSSQSIAPQQIDPLCAEPLPLCSNVHFTPFTGESTS